MPWISQASNIWLDKYAMSVLRSVVISWAAVNYPAQKFDLAARNAASASSVAGNVAEIEDEDEVVAEAAYSASNAADTVASVLANDSAVEAADAPNEVGAGTVFWDSVKKDCDWLDQRNSPRSAPRVLSRQPIWLERSKDIRELDLTPLLEIDTNYSIWLVWYERRIRGERAAFNIPGDKYRKEDKIILRRLAEATDEDFWGKGHEYVNATLRGWIEEARARLAVNGKLADAEAAALPAQAHHAVRFRAAADGRIAVDAAALADTLRTDAEARDRHAEAVALARAMLAGCQGSNAGARMIAMLEAYLEAAGDGIETMRPSLFVQRGERLRQELAGYARPDTMLAPLADAVLLDGQSWRSAHNMAVGLDPVLMALDTAQRGPDLQPAPLEPVEIRTLARAADAAGALVEGVAAVVIEAADLAPAVPDPADRRTRWSSDTAQNLVIEAFAVALNYPLTTITGIATFGALGWAGAAVFGGALGAAKFLISHRLWIETRLGDSPTWQSLFVLM
jgi:hypothetical protein